MLHVLHSHEVLAARAAQRLARAVHVAVAPTAGVEGGRRAYDAFMSEMHDIATFDPFAPAAERGPTDEELATFDRIAAAAR